MVEERVEQLKRRPKQNHQKTKKDGKDVVIEDVSDEPINLDDIPF